MRTTLPVLSLIALSLTAVQTAFAAVATVDAEADAAARKAEPSKCDGSPGTTCMEPWTRRVTIGPGLTAGSFRFDGKIGFLDSVVPIEVGYNGFQRTYVGAGAGGKNRVILWRAALGLTFAKRAGEEDIAFGAYVMPWGVQVENFAAGIGLSYRAVGELANRTDSWAVVIPFSYTVQIGGL